MKTYQQRLECSSNKLGILGNISEQSIRLWHLKGGHMINNGKVFKAHSEKEKKQM